MKTEIEIKIERKRKKEDPPVETYINPVYNVSGPLIKAKLTMKARNNNNECYISKIKRKHGRTGKAVHADGL